MWSRKASYVIAREDNIVVVDFGRKPEPPQPRFPGANGLRETSHEAFELQLKFPLVKTVI
jgi:hypothetical protein